MPTSVKETKACSDGDTFFLVILTKVKSGVFKVFSKLILGCGSLYNANCITHAYVSVIFETFFECVRYISMYMYV